jgi:hypothetical protein
MPLPELTMDGDLPPGVHRATMDEVISRFGGQGAARQRCTKNLKHVYQLANSTGQLERLVIFGSYVTDKESPNDIDVILVMNDAFHADQSPIAARSLFDHSVAQRRFGASVFWIKPSMAIGEPLDEFIAHWQSKRDDTLRGIVEIVR